MGSSLKTTPHALTVIPQHLQIDSALLGHPDVVEAVSFGAPDEKYGEIVAAAVVLAKPASDPAALIADIKRVASQKLAPFKACPSNLHPCAVVFQLLQIQRQTLYKAMCIHSNGGLKHTRHSSLSTDSWNYPACACIQYIDFLITAMIPTPMTSHSVPRDCKFLQDLRKAGFRACA